MKKIKVRFEGFAVYLNENGYFRCPHLNAEVDEPCCFGFDSEGYPSYGYRGEHLVLCPDCNNQDMTDFEAEVLIDNYIEEQNYENI